MSNDVSDFRQIIKKGLTRREFCTHTSQGMSALGMGLFLTCNPLSEAVAKATNAKSEKLLGFVAVPASSEDNFIVPDGYVAKPLISWGDPILKNAPKFDASGNQSAAVQSMQFGDNSDGMSLFPITENRALLAVNNEFANHRFLFSHHGFRLTAEDVKKSQAAHGVSIFEIQKNRDGSWSYIQDSPYNRRITATTKTELTGPVAGHPLVKTKADPTGKQVFGTINNCANGQTPWGTYLTCEENFHYYFSTDERVKRTAEQKRYGFKARDKRNFQWYKHQSRFDYAKEPNEANRFGWVVEIDPFDPDSVPRKRTALGRFQHENAALTISHSGHVVIYMGDDQGGEHIYKFISKNPYTPDEPTANKDLLDEGTLYVARFDARPGELKGLGKWLELSHGKNGLNKKNGFANQAEVLLFARLAATVVGATTMDRPEWVAIHPDKQAVYATLTKNKLRGLKKNQPVNGPNPRKANSYGQIVRWWPKNADHISNEFSWDLFLLAGNPSLHFDGLNAGSPNINTDNMFSCPDGLGFDQAGRLWILTDGNYTNSGFFAGMGNNQVLCADPDSGEIRRFATGPVGCEMTGLAFTPDQRTFFVGIQHPGGKIFTSHFPGGGDSKPRSTIMMVQKKDGGIIGS